MVSCEQVTTRLLLDNALPSVLAKSWTRIIRAWRNISRSSYSPLLSFILRSRLESHWWTRCYLAYMDSSWIFRWRTLGMIRPSCRSTWLAQDLASSTGTPPRNTFLFFLIRRTGYACSIHTHTHTYTLNTDILPFFFYFFYFYFFFGGKKTSFISCPMELSKIRLQNQDQAAGVVKSGSSGLGTTFYKGPMDCFKQTYRQGGLRACYRGLWSTILRETSYGPYFLSYEIFCRALTPEGQRTQDLSSGRLVVAGGFAGIAGWLSTYPTGTFRSIAQHSRLQNLPFF